MSREDVLLEAAELDDGESVRIVCPVCGGGSSKERSMSITKTDGTVLWNCHRLSCEGPGARGAAGDRGGYFVRTKQPERQRKITPYTGSLSHLNGEWRSFLEEKIGWTEEHLIIARPMYADEEDRVAFPIFGPLGYRRGWVLRSYEPFERTKALTRMDVDEPHLSWYRRKNNNSCIVVEDIPSAVRASIYSDAVALMGTGCNYDYAMEIAAYYPNVVWALDSDATAESIRLCRKYSALFRDSRVLILDKDLKDQEEEELMRNITGVLNE